MDETLYPAKRSHVTPKSDGMSTRPSPSVTGCCEPAPHLSGGGQKRPESYSSQKETRKRQPRGGPGLLLESPVSKRLISALRASAPARPDLGSVYSTAEHPVISCRIKVCLTVSSSRRHIIISIISSPLPAPNPLAPSLSRSLSLHQIPT